MNTLWQDIRYGARVLLSRPGFTVVAVLALALGIGANSAIFSVVNAVVLRPLPFDGAERLLVMQMRSETTGNVGTAQSYANFIDVREQAATLEGAFAYSQSSAFLAAGDEPERVRGVITTADIFPVLGAKALHGRVFTREDDQKGARRVAVLSHGLWQRRFGSDPSIVGQEIPLGGIRNTPTLVLGVMPEGFKYPVVTDAVDFWMPIVPTLSDSDISSRGSIWLTVVAKRKEGATLEQAQAELQTISKRLQEQYPDTNSAAVFTFTPLHDRLVGDLRTALYVLLGAVAFVLLIACANVANLLLSRAATRHKEISIRTALGASRWRIVRQLLTESLMLALAGGAAGLLFAWWGVDLLVAASPTDLPRAAEIGLDLRVVLFTLGVSVLTGVVFGVVPALQASRSDITESLKEGGRGSTEGGRSRVRSVLVVSEFALSLVLLVGAGLLAQSFARLLGVSPGFDPSGVVTADVVFRGDRFAQGGAQRTAALEEIVQGAAGMPGVSAVGAVSPLPLGGNFIAYSFQIVGQPPPEPGRAPSADFRSVTPDYFRVMGIPLVRGRGFDARDGADSQRVAVINETFARKYFPDQNPLGQRLDFSDGEPDPTSVLEIVGMVGDVRHAGLEEESGPEYYVPFAQSTAPRVTIVARSASGDTSALAGSLRGIVRQVDKNLPVFNVRTMDELLSESVARRRFNMALLAGFALVALLLACLGIYGVMSYTVAQRTHEIGIRMALGAQASQIVRMVVRQGMLLAVVGVVIGTIGALLLTRWMESLLYGVSATDPMTFVAVALGLGAVALLACFIPARRASRVDPMEALRYE
jgi:putative ABC transport system permease protein